MNLLKISMVVPNRVYTFSHLFTGAFYLHGSILWVVNRMDQGYGADIPLNAKEKREHTFKILKEWPNVVKELHLKNICNPKWI